MSDTNAITAPEPEPTDSSSGQGFKKGPLLVLGGLGCSLLICLALLAGSSVLFWPDAPGGEPAMEDEVAPAPQPPAQAAEFGQNQRSDTLSLTAAEQRKSASDNLGDILTANTPQLGRITFAASTTQEGQPVEPNFIFEAGITEIHAVFEYGGMSPEVMWSQVWYYNGDEVFSATQPWLEGRSGVFDYVIEAGGEPFTPGEWTLELYVEDELLSGGSFLIESQNE